ncbi:MAG: 2-oxoacid:acceptor oxidoreductase subunit alpha [Gammaproteobacteria bacterium]|jgi:2-oxoglutarate ferredoxin oxidoreductase subunit alpha|nr:2-oxoacid:acceptor oxidoreductase subunit alpha [Gammaproteobacteria bacterium]MBP6051900.1 2-oxoacid:acceptor oxidoreductase subunit alpha [Pseudomonadales bacterium]MBK7169414.1 2-oxoacid:acceptor oxidoreductase subunit alpha [Gammaproteobacteria bacterium]MBK7520715.1 2-oxoacid:acceptor oxidoreductase subunit alpha [Gammaproteobacteria bacterium]MBK7728372.1 2-oxoacid:acceptor oxidoreductase subunit alpha [Gammaproteobacteria bacterium]
MSNASEPGPVNLEGNHACALAAIAAGCRFYAGYPITPSSEIAERLSLELPRVDGIFIQMEDEIASMGAILGASMGGMKVMTATSGPGFSLKQENLGYAAAAEIPCVIVNVMRGGPSTGLPTRPAQGDIMQARWGTHGDHPIVVITPASVPEIYEQTIRAFNLAEALRVPVILLYDEAIGHLRETVEIRDSASIELRERKWASGPAAGFQPYAAGEDGVPQMVRPGDGFRTHTTGLTHAPDGFPTQDPVLVQQYMRRLLGKLEQHRELVESFEAVAAGDAEILLVCYGITSRAARRALKLARNEGIKVGMFRPITVWPFPAQALKAVLGSVKNLLVPEMNAGQLIQEIERHCPAGCRVEGLNRIDGETITPDQILHRIRELASHE